MDERQRKKGQGRPSVKESGVSGEADVAVHVFGRPSGRKYVMLRQSRQSHHVGCMILLMYVSL